MTLYIDVYLFECLYFGKGLVLQCYPELAMFGKLQYHDQIEFFVYEFAVPVKLAHLTY